MTSVASMTRMTLIATLFGAILVLRPIPLLAQSIVADLDDYFVAITANFSGHDITIFGAIEPEFGQDVIIVVRGPTQKVRMQKKERVFGLWINQMQMSFDDVPAFYAVASSSSLDAIVVEEFLAKHQIGGQYLNMERIGGNAQSRAEQERFNQALVDAKQNAKLFTIAPLDVRLLGETLFRTDIRLPGNAPPGSYLIYAYHIGEGEIVGAQTMVLEVSRTGLSAEISTLAEERPVIYGLLAILIAVSLGWGTGLIFQRI